jgi:dienelactone hydrolase
MRIYEDAHHLFDMAELPPETTGPLGTMGYNKAAAEAAWIEVTDFLKR